MALLSFMDGNAFYYLQNLKDSKQNNFTAISKEKDLRYKNRRSLVILLKI